jgi:hypothetical protein
MAHGVTEAQGEVACRICGEEDCVLHRGVVTVAQLVNVMLGLGALIGSMAVAWAWAFRGSTL